MEEGIDAADRALDQRWPGFAPRATVTLRATLIDGLGQRWTSAVPTAADQEGRVALDAAVDGEPDALIWSMSLEPPPGRPALPYIDACTDGLEALELELAAGGERRGLVRRLVDPQTSVTMARGTGFAATVFSPPSSPPDRCALVLGGSGGATAWSWQVAALLASHGHRAAAVAYFDWSGQPGLPRSITGPEMRDWKQVRLDAGIDVFFCDPHAPWQRGSNENTNGLLRQYFPKGTDFAAVSEAQLDAVADELNDRPRKRLGFAKPAEEIAELLLH